MEYDDTRKDAPAARDDAQKPQDHEKDAKTEKTTDDGKYTFSDWASI